MKIYALSNSTQFAKLLVDKLNGDNMPTHHLKYVRKQKFNDGEINVTFDESIRGESLILVAQVEMPYENFFELLQTIDAARRCSAKEITVVIPYLLHSRQERRDDKRSPISARLIADMLQNAGANRIISMDIHTTAIEGFYHIPFDKLSPFEIYVEKIKELFKQRCGNLKLVSPDFGFIKKMEKYQEALGCDMAVINKTRVKANEVSKMELIGDVKECHVILIDDLIDTATTLVKAADLVLSKGALSVTVLSTHGVLSEGAVKRLMLSNIETVYISNTISKNLDTYELEKIKTIDVSDIFAKAILKIENE